MILTPRQQACHIMRLEVRDTGCGIAPDALPSIFERMYRADQARAAKHGGSGLGLAIAKTIVEAHGGTISADSTPGAGTRMVILLPLGAGQPRIHILYILLANNL